MEPLLTKKTFKCDRYCGECCKKMLVGLNERDIKRIKSLGFKEEEFVSKDFFNSKKSFLKKNEKGWCVFLSKDGKGKYSCKIHKNRPEICRQYPFFGRNPKPIKSCLPRDLYPNVFFSFSNIKNNQ